MIVKFLSRTQWEAKLRRWGCRPLEGKTPLNTAEWWLGPKGDYPFTVPTQNDGTCDFWAIWKLCENFGRSPHDDMDTEH